MELIQTIREELLKSAELTGIWEKKLREIERHTYSASQFIGELKQMVTDIVRSVMADTGSRRISVQAAAPSSAAAKPAAKKRKTAASAPATSVTSAPSTTAPTASAADSIVGQPCPLCGTGTVLKGKTAYGCSRWKEGCTFRKPFTETDK